MYDPRVEPASSADQASDVHLLPKLRIARLRAPSGKCEGTNAYLMVGQPTATITEGRERYGAPQDEGEEFGRLGRAHLRKCPNLRRQSRQRHGRRHALVPSLGSTPSARVSYATSRTALRRAILGAVPSSWSDAPLPLLSHVTPSEHHCS